jgi:hypothetical protein
MRDVLPPDADRHSVDDLGVDRHSADDLGNRHAVDDLDDLHAGGADRHANPANLADRPSRNRGETHSHTNTSPGRASHPNTSNSAARRR